MAEKKTQHDSEILAEGKQVMSACVFIHHNFDGVEKLFLARRAETKKFLPGILELPGGHIDFGEDLIDGLKREIKEEFGMDIHVGDPFSAFTYENQIKKSHTIEVIYFATFAEDLKHIAINPEDHSSFEWFTAEDAVRRREEIVPQDHVIHGYDDDPEYLTILRGFVLLGDGELNFG